MYRGIDKGQQLGVALKVLKQDATDIVRRRLESLSPWEGEIALQVDHPHVVQTYECGPWKDTYFLAMELVEGYNLKFLLINGSPFVKARKYHLLYQIAKGLAHVHERGFIHRDLCPKNIIISKKGVPKIIDFGLTIPTKMAAKCPDTRSGTPSYMAPEQIRVKMFDERCDIYSFGVTMYEVLTRKHPFEFDTRESKMAGHLNFEAPPLSRYDKAVTEPVQELVSKAMAKDPRERFGSMSELISRMHVIFPAKAVEEKTASRTGAEDRRFERVQVQCFVRLRPRGFWPFRREYRTVTRDISLDGVCYVDMRRPMKKGQRLDMDIQLRGDRVVLPVTGEVTWCRPSQGQSTYELGVEFHRVSDAVRDKLRRYIAARHAETEP